MRKKYLLLIVKYAVALAMLAWILSQANLEDMRDLYRRLAAWEILAAFVFFNLGQCFSSERMRYYYRHAGFAMPRGFAVRLTYASMFYNIVIPGGIGGDAYRVALLKKIQAVPVKTGIRLQLSNRMSGLVAICLLIFVLTAFSSVDIPGEWMAGGIVLGTVSLVAVYTIVILPLLKEERNVAAGAVLWSLLAQMAALVAVAALSTGLGAGVGHLPDYMILYLAAALAGMLPITIGGLGIREFTFFYGAQFIDRIGGATLTPELGVALALSFFCLTLVSSFIGIIIRVVDTPVEDKNVATYS